MDADNSKTFYDYRKLENRITALQKELKEIRDARDADDTVIAKLQDSGFLLMDDFEEELDDLVSDLGKLKNPCAEVLIPTLGFKTLRIRNNNRAVEWTGVVPSMDQCQFFSIELAGEVGEALNIVKKYIREVNNWTGGLAATDATFQLADELADVVITADLLASTFNIDLSAAVVNKFNKTSEKHNLKERL
ncbi:MAG: hypothetical protein DRH08_01830 [Deltaproteobacteria bacterium]|nr:MAG: hypothetical protein DRH08_01830 [Deltaproteobacteria bacterium]